MKLIASLLATAILVVVGWGAAQAGAGRFIVGTVLPYAALLIFFAGVIWKVIDWARSPVPFRITTTCGQQKSLKFLPREELENPSSKLAVIGRMALEVLAFRSLFRNTRMAITEGEDQKSKVVYGPTKWLWMGALIFHWTFLVILLRHLRFFTEPVPTPILWLTGLDGFLQVGVPVIYATTGLFLAAVTYLFIRRVIIPQVRFISLPADYFPLFILIGIGGSGMLLRHIAKTDITAVKQLTIGLLSLSAEVPAGIHWLFFVHLLLVSVLLAYFPFSKLMHMGGVFLSPTRNLTGNTREVRHINPWNAPVEVHSYAAYVEEFRQRMEEADIPIEPVPKTPSHDHPNAQE